MRHSDDDEMIVDSDEETKVPLKSEKAKSFRKEIWITMMSKPYSYAKR